MQDRNRDDEYQQDHQRKKPSRKTVNIQFARSLSSNELIAILQEKLIIARNEVPGRPEISLLAEIAHDIKFRLAYYARLYGEVDRDAYSSSTEARDY